MHKSLITPSHIEEKAKDILRSLDGQSFSEAAYVLDEASVLLERARSRLSEQPFSFSRDCSPKDEAGRP